VQTYPIDLERVIDGDTIVCTVHIWQQMHLPGVRVRLLGIDAPELKSPTWLQGEKSKQQLSDLLDGQPLHLHCPRPITDDFGRVLGEVWIYSDTAAPFDVQLSLLRSGHAVAWERHKKKC